jgi:glycosyltransferase involved in cell wall biosynthesis
MRNAVVVIYIYPKVKSNWSNWCLEPIRGKPVLTHLLNRLQKGLPVGDFQFFILSHEEGMPEQLLEISKDTGVPLFVSKSTGRLRALTDLIKGKGLSNTLLLFPETAIFPDCRLTIQMLQKHRDEHMEGTVTADFPIGLLPEIYEPKALIRLSDLELPEDVTGEIISVMEKANALFQDDEDQEFQFDLLRLSHEDLRNVSTLKNLPSRLLLTNSFYCRVAGDVIDRLDGKVRYDSTEAYYFKSEILRLEVSPMVEFPAAATVHPGTIPILYSTPYSAFSGGEESYAQMIIHMDRTRFQPYVVLASRGILSEKLRAAGLPVEIMELHPTGLDPMMTRYFDDLLTRLKIKIVHTNGFVQEALALSAYYAGIPLVGHMRVFMGMQTPALLNYYSQVISISKAVTEDVLRSDIHPEKVCTVYNGVDLSLFNPANYDRSESRRHAGISPETHVICLIARIDPQKRLEFLLDALPKVLEKFPDTLVLIVGEAYAAQAKYLEELKEKIAKMELQDHVRFWGFEKDIGKVHALSDVLVYCTLNEPFGRSILEAQALGTPVVVPDRGGPPEIIQHNENGLLYDARSPDHLAVELIRLFGSPDLPKRLIAAGFKTVQAFDIKMHVQNIIDIYDKLI